MAETEIRVTLDTLFEVLRVEKKRGELQPLPEGFLSDAKEYISHKQAMAQGDDRVKGQLEQAHNIIREFFLVRERKLLELARLRADSERVVATDGMLEQEKEYYEQLIGILKAFRLGMIGQIKKPRAVIQQDEEPEITSDIVRVQITSQMPQFMDQGMRVFGPYNEGEEVELPPELAEIIITRGCGKRV
jgi:DNA replication initiation complex subunit (GINS family)